MFNQPHPARAAVPWQPHAGIAQKLSSRGYATTSWTDEEPEHFADLGYPAKAGGFSAAHYQPSKQALSKQAQASLALLEGEYRNEALGEEKPASVPGTETNEHLPFVMDAYGASRKSKLRVNVAPSVLQRALAQAELAESLVVSPITSDDTSAELIVIHPDVPDEQVAALEAMAAQETAQALLGEPSSSEAAKLAEPAEPELPAVVGGISPDEVAQREAEQFAKGMAQAREEAATELARVREQAAADLAEAVRQATEDALAQGLEQGKVEGLAEGLEQGLAQGIEQGMEQGHVLGKEQGLAEGEANARAVVADEMAAQRVVFETASQELNTLLADPKKFFEPLKRLAMHIAEQVVVGELQTSSKGIERLVQRCLDELDHPVHGAVVLELNPQDKALLQAQAGDFIKGMRLEAVHEMQRGSVRVFANDTVIEDLVDHRLEGLAKALLIDDAAWREKSPLAKRILEIKDDQQEEAEDGDVHS